MLLLLEAPAKPVPKVWAELRVRNPVQAPFLLRAGLAETILSKWQTNGLQVGHFWGRF